MVRNNGNLKLSEERKEADKHISPKERKKYSPCPTAPVCIWNFNNPCDRCCSSTKGGDRRRTGRSRAQTRHSQAFVEEWSHYNNHQEQLCCLNRYVALNRHPWSHTSLPISTETIVRLIPYLGEGRDSEKSVNDEKP